MVGHRIHSARDAVVSKLTLCADFGWGRRKPGDLERNIHRLACLGGGAVVIVDAFWNHRRDFGGGFSPRGIHPSMREFGDNTPGMTGSNDASVAALHPRNKANAYSIDSCPHRLT